MCIDVNGTLMMCFVFRISLKREKNMHIPSDITATAATNMNISRSMISWNYDHLSGLSELKTEKDFSWTAHNPDKPVLIKWKNIPMKKWRASAMGVIWNCTLLPDQEMNTSLLCLNLFLEGQCPTEFSSNLPPKNTCLKF